MVPRLSRFTDFIHIKSRKDLPHLGLVIFLVLGIILGVSLALQPQIFNKRAAEETLIEVKFIPEVLQVESGKTYEVKIAVNPKGQRVTAAKIHINYDPEVVSILKTTNAGFLPVTLKTEDSRDGDLTMIFASTIDSQPDQAGMLAGIEIKALNPFPSTLQVMPDSEVTVSSQEENVLTVFPKLAIEPLESTLAPGETPGYPDNLLLEKAFFPSSSPYVRDFKEILEPDPELKPERVKPEFSITFVRQLGTDIFISPIVALNQVLEEGVGGGVWEMIEDPASQ